MKRLHLLLVVILLAGLFGIQPPLAQATGAAAHTANKTITIWHQWNGAYLTAIQQYFDQYMLDHPDVSITLSNQDDMLEALKVAIPAGTGPDIIAWANDQIGFNAKMGYIVDLGALGVDDSFLTSTYEPAAAAGVKWSGKIWALPESIESVALVYNPGLVTAAYRPSDPLDFADLASKAASFHTATGKQLMCNQGFPGGDAYHIAPVFFGYGVPGYIDDAGHVYANTAQAVAAGSWLAALPPFSPADQDYDSCRNALLAGNVGMWWTGPWAMADLEANHFSYAILPMGKPFVGIKTMMVTSNAVSRNNAAAALDLIKAYTGFAASKALTLVNKTIPANTAALHDTDVQALTTVAGFGAAAALGVPMSSSPFSSCQWGPMGDAETAIWDGSQTPTEALNGAQALMLDCIQSLKTNITIWHQWYEPYLGVSQQFFDQYMLDHPDVSISLHKSDDFIGDLNQAIPGGSGPDIVAWTGDAIGTLASNKWIVDLNQLGVDDSFMSSTYEPAAAAGVKWNGKTWGLPETIESIALVYNPSLVTAAYLPSDPLDFADLASKAAAFKSATGKPLLCNQGFAGGDAYHIAPVFFGFGVPGFVDDAGNAYANTAQAIAAGMWLAALPLISGPDQNFDACRNALLAGDVGMWWTGPWAIADLEANNFTYGIVPMGKAYVGIRSMMVTSNAVSRGSAAAALDLIKAYTGFASSKALSLASKYIPANTAALHDPEVQALTAIAGFGSAAALGIPMSLSPYSGCQWGPMGDAEAAIWDGSQTPTAALNTAQSQIVACVRVLKMTNKVFLPVMKK